MDFRSPREGNKKEMPPLFDLPFPSNFGFGLILMEGDDDLCATLDLDVWKRKLEKIAEMMNITVKDDAMLRIFSWTEGD